MSEVHLVREKLNQAGAILAELDVDVWLTFVRESFMMADPVLDFILGQHVTWQSAFLLTRDGRAIAIVGHYDGDAVRGLGAYEVITYHEGLAAPLRKTLADLEPRHIAVNYSDGDPAADGLTHGLYRTLRGHLAGSPFVDRLVSAERVIAALRGRKSPSEVARIQAAIDATERLFDAVEAYARPGMTQRQIADFVRARVDAAGHGYAWDRAYNPIVTCGPHSAIGHAVAGDVPLEPGHTLHLDLGLRVDGYCSDLQRMWYVLADGERVAPPDVQRAFDVVRGAIEAGRGALRPGAPGYKVDAVARDFIVDNGYPEYMHAFGHLLGRAAHDGATVLGPQWERYAGVADRPAEAGNVFTLELHVVVPERGIMSLEEDVLVTADGADYLSTPQTTLRYIRGDERR